MISLQGNRVRSQSDFNGTREKKSFPITPAVCKTVNSWGASGYGHRVQRLQSLHFCLFRINICARVLDFFTGFWLYWRGMECLAFQGIHNMNQEQVRGRQPLYTQIDVSPSAYPQSPQAAHGGLAEQIRLLRELVAAQDRQNELLEELVSQLNAQGKQRASELGQWKAANPKLARNCRLATEALGKVQTEFLETLTQEINTNYESLMDGEFMLNEFVDRFGPRMAHLNGLLQVLSQLSAMPNPTNTPNTP
jgi:hypothetical protein